MLSWAWPHEGKIAPQGLQKEVCALATAGSVGLLGAAAVPLPCKASEKTPCPGLIEWNQ